MLQGHTKTPLPNYKKEEKEPDEACSNDALLLISVCIVEVEIYARERCNSNHNGDGQCFTADQDNWLEKMGEENRKNSEERRIRAQY